MVRVVLGKHCIEGSSREKYQELVQALLTGRAEPEAVEKDMELLEDFLKRVDFAKLRTTYPDLDGRREVEVSIERAGQGFEIDWDRGRVKVGEK